MGRKKTATDRKHAKLSRYFQELLVLVHQAGMVRGNDTVYACFGKLLGRIKVEVAQVEVYWRYLDFGIKKD